MAYHFQNFIINFKKCIFTYYSDLIANHNTMTDMRTGIESYYPSLEVLANQCPYQGGNAVYRARYFVGLLNDSIEFNDDFNCLAAGIWRNSNTSNDLQISMNVIPNPTSGKFKLSFSSPIQEKFQLLIVDINGKNVYKSTTTIDGIEFEINIRNLISGIYQVQLIGEKVGVFNERLTILK